jgi:membrane fusion protein (multidrug efflux system)
MTEQTSGADQQSGAAARIDQRKKLLFKLLVVVVVTGGAWLAFWYFYGSRFVSTDNAYTAVEISQVTPSVEGTVKAVNVSDTQHVQEGDVLALIDDADTRLAVLAAQAELGRATRRVEGYFANDQSLAAQVLAREAEEQRAQAQLTAAQADDTRAGIDLRRRQALEKSGSVSGEELTRAENAASAASANLAVARANLALARANLETTRGMKLMNQTLIAGTTIQDNPEVVFARAKVEQAQLNQERTTVRAPVSGVIAKRQVQVGQRVQAGTPMLSVVPVQLMYVNANFKEVQLPKVKVGQSVELTSDLYGDQVVFKGIVEGFAGGTGSAFAVIPAQNATGNWIKVVQRVPVRIKLDSDQLKKNPLTVGLSMTVRIDVSAR